MDSWDNRIQYGIMGLAARRSDNIALCKRLRSERFPRLTISLFRSDFKKFEPRIPDQVA